MKKIVSLSTKEELCIYMSPQRQQLLRVMRLDGKPMTAKALAGRLGISASSTTHHISKLVQLGILEQDHTKIINGIVARFFRLADVTVNIGLQYNDKLSGERSALIQNILLNTLNGMNEGFEKAKQMGIPAERYHEFGDVLSGVVHLPQEDAVQLFAIIKNFIESHKDPSEHSQPWEYALILYNSGEAP